MPLFRSALPQLSGRPFLTDGGLETTLVFLEGLSLPCFAAFPLLCSKKVRAGCCASSNPTSRSPGVTGPA
jgi:hypothetical protein